MNATPTRILVVDDSALYRQSIHNVLRDVEDAEIVGIARDGVEALKKIETLDPDLLTLDVQMPDMDGIQLLRELKRRRLRAKAIMVSSFTSEGAAITTEALMEGAFDFILKPTGKLPAANRQTLQDSLAAKITAFREAARMRTSAQRQTPTRLVANAGVAEPSPAAASPCQIVVIGASTGGPSALKMVLPKLPADFPVPIVVVQHMPAQYTASLASRLNEISALTVVEAQDGMTAKAGYIYVAPGGRQLKMTRQSRTGAQLKKQGAGEAINGEHEYSLRVTDDPPTNGVRPSVDYVIASACEHCEDGVLSVIMTGMGRDGLTGSQQVKQLGGYVFAQHQDDCIVYGMPKVIIEAQLADRILPLGKIAPAIVRHVKRSRRSTIGKQS